MSRGNATVELSSDGKRKLFRKQILPKSTISYKGRTVNFDEQYLADLKAAFEARAFDQVPFQLADERNTHTNDPERFRGELVGVELTADGLDGIFDLTPEGAAVVERNPNLGVSARIIENLERADGKVFPRATQHVLGTLDPRVTGMKPWQTVELSAEAVTETIDLSATDYPVDGHQEVIMPEGTQEKVTLELSRDDALALQELLADHRAAIDLANGDKEPEEPNPSIPPRGGDTEDDGTGETRPPKDWDKEPSTTDSADEDEDEDEESEEGSADGEESSEDTEPGADGEDVNLTAEAAAAVELANATASTASEHVLELSRQLRKVTTERELDKYRATGLAPAIIEAARPAFEADPQTIELSNGETTDTAEVVRNVLNQVIQLANTGHDLIDLDRESGVLTGADSTEESRAALLTAWDNEYPA